MNRFSVFVAAALLLLTLAPFVGSASADHVNPDIVETDAQPVPPPCDDAVECIQYVYDQLGCEGLMGCSEEAFDRLPQEFPNARPVYDAGTDTTVYALRLGGIAFVITDAYVEFANDMTRNGAYLAVDTTWCLEEAIVHGTPCERLPAFNLERAGPGDAFFEAFSCSGLKPCSYYVLGLLPHDAPNTAPVWDRQVDWLDYTFDRYGYTVSTVDGNVEYNYDWTVSTARNTNSYAWDVACTILTGDPNCGGDSAERAVLSTLLA